MGSDAMESIKISNNDKSLVVVVTLAEPEKEQKNEAPPAEPQKGTPTHYRL